MRVNKDLLTFLSPYSRTVQEIALELREFIITLVPEANELIWDNYNAVAITYSKSEKLKDAFCHISVYTKHVNLGFNRGAELLNCKVKLEGKGKLIRHIHVLDMASFETDNVREMIFEALAISEERNIDLLNKKSEGMSFVMSISKKKKRPIKLS